MIVVFIDKNFTQDYFHKTFKAFVKTNTNPENVFLTEQNLNLLSIKATENLHNLFLNHNIPLDNSAKQNIYIKFLYNEGKPTMEINGYEQFANFLSPPKEELNFTNKKIYIYNEVYKKL